MAKNLKIEMDIEDVGRWIIIGAEISSYKDCLVYARNTEEREIWRQKWAEAQIKRTAIMDEFILKYGGKSIQLDGTRNITVETYMNTLILPIVNNDGGDNNEKQ